MLAILVGVVAGIWYGRVIHPVEYTDTTLDALRGDYKTDYVLMVAETFAGQKDTQLAISQLSELSGGDPRELVTQAILFAQRAGYAEQDLRRLETLLQALQPAANPTITAAP